MGAIVKVRTKILKRQGKKMQMPATKGNDEIRDIEPTKFYQTVGIPLKDPGAEHMLKWRVGGSICACRKMLEQIN